MTLGAPLINKHAPADRLATWIALFYMTIPVGYAAGLPYAAGVAAHLSWRWVYLLAAIVMVPFSAVFAIAIPNSQKVTQDGQNNAEDDGSTTTTSVQQQGDNRHSQDQNQDQDEDRLTVCGFFQDLAYFFANPTWVCLSLGNAGYWAACGVFMSFGPQFATFFLGMDLTTAASIFGVLTALTSIFGVLGGGAILQKMGPSTEHAIKLSAIVALIGFPFSIACLYATVPIKASSHIGAVIFFSATAGLGLFFENMSTGPVNSAFMWCVPPKKQAASVGTSQLLMHIIGDAPSPIYFPFIISAFQPGASEGGTEYTWSWIHGFSIIMSLFFVSGIMYFIGWRFSIGRPCYAPSEKAAVQSTKTDSVAVDSVEMDAGAKV